MTVDWYLILVCWFSFVVSNVGLACAFVDIALIQDLDLFKCILKSCWIGRTESVPGMSGMEN